MRDTSARIDELRYETHLNRATVLHATIRFYCDRCEQDAVYEYRASHVSPDWPEWRELAEKSARLLHDEQCPPRRGLYREALGIGLTIKPK